MTYNADNELASVDNELVSNDLNGNLTYGPLTNDNFVNLAFDARNRLMNAGGVTNVYDAINDRIGQTYGTNSVEYVVDPNWKLPRVLMSIKNNVTNYYVYGMGLLYQVTETTNGEKTLYYDYDYRGSTVALTDSSGQVVDRFQYSLYGTMTYRTGTNNTPFLFNGRYGVMSDPNGLLYLNARYYSPYLCRFINPDPTGFKGGLNWYAYANGNPVTMSDPSGMGAIGDYTGWNWLDFGSTAPDLNNPFGLSPSAESTSTYWNPNEYYNTAAIWQHDINNSYSWPVAGSLDTLVQIGAGIASFGYFGSGSGYFAANPSWQTAPGLLGDIGTGAGFLAGGLSPLSFASESIFGGAAGTTTADSPMITVLGSGRDVAPYVGQSGFNTFTGAGIPTAELDTQNALWLNNAIQRGDQIWLVTDPQAHASLLQSLPGQPQSAYLNLELPMLNEYGELPTIPKYITGGAH